MQCAITSCAGCSRSNGLQLFLNGKQCKIQIYQFADHQMASQRMKWIGFKSFHSFQRGTDRESARMFAIQSFTNLVVESLERIQSKSRIDTFIGNTERTSMLRKCGV